MTTFPLQSQPADSGSRHLRNLTPTDKALLTRARRNGGGQALRRAVALAYERFGDEIRDAGGIYNVPALRDPETAALLLQRFGSGDQISTGGDTWLTQWNANNIPQTRPGRIDISDVWFEEYVDAISANSNLGSGDLFDDARRVRRRADERESAEQRRIERELIGKALDYRDSLTSRPVPADLQRLEETLKHSAQRVIEATDEGGRRHRRYELDDGSALVFWQHPRRGRTREEVEGVALGTHRSRLALLPSNLRYPALFNGRRDEDAAVPASVREYQSIQYGGQGEGTVDRHHAAPSPDIERDYLTYLQELRRQGRVDVRDPRVSSPGLRVMRVGRDAPPPRDLRPFTVRQAGSDAAEWHNRLGADPNATPDDALQELDDLGAERTVRPDRESVRLAFPDASNALIDMRTGDVRPLEKRARSSAPRGPEPARPEQSFASTNNQDKLPFRFADRDLPAYAHDDPSRATPGINLDPEANRDTLGEYGRLWQSQSGHLEAERLRAEGKPVQADLRTLTADAWLKSNEPGPTDAGRQSARTDARLAAALSSMVSLEGEAQAHIEDWLARLQRNSQEQRAEHYREAERLQTQGRAEQAAIHQHIADRWADPNQGVQREVLEPELASQGWQVVSLDDHKEFFDKRVFRFRDPKSGRFQVWRGFFTHDLPAVHRLIRERYGAAAYLAQYTDTRRGVASAHPFAVIDGAVHGAYDPQNLATPQPITHIYVPPPGWTPPGFQIDSDRLRARNERERVRQDAGRGATPTEITQDIEDIYERVAAGTNLTDSQAAEIRLAIREAQEAAAEASAAADRAHLLSNAAQGFLRGARADLDRSQSTGGADTGEFDGRELADPEPNATPTEPGILHGPEIPDASPDLATDPFAVADPGPDSEGDLLSVPGQSGRRLTLEELQEVAAVGADPRSPADINDRALYKAEKADAIADEAVQASQEAVLAASRMTRAFARLRELAREANRRADALPDDVDDVAQTYADMADAEIDGTMPLVERTNRAALQSRDLALMVAEEADDLLDDVRQFRGSLQNDLGEAYSPPTPEEQARGRASERYTRELATGAELEARITELQSRVGARQTASGPPAPVVNENDGVKLQPSLTPGRVYIPEGQPTMLGKDSRGRTVRGYEVSGDFYPTGDLSPVMDPDTGQQSYQDPPDWLDQSDPRARRRLLYTTNILPWIKPPPASGPSESQPEPPPGPKDLRDYQERIITELDDALDQENSVLVTAPTGAGKTVAFAEKIRRLRAEGKNVAVIAHRQELIEQAEKTIAAQTGETPGVVWQNRREWGRPITIIAHGALLTNDPPVGYRPDVVIADEAHHAIAPGWQQAIDKLHAKQLIGFTATPFRSDELPLTPKPFARVINPVTPAQLIEKGVLVPPKVESVALTDDQGAPQPINKASNLPQVYAESVSYALSQGRRKIIVFVSQSTDDSPSEVAKNTEQELKRLGINTRTIIAGGLTPNERREAIKEFEEAPSAVMVNYMTLTEGTDVPSTDTVILGRNTQSETSLIQMIGRGMRPSAGKRNVLVLDFTGRDDIADIVNYWRVDAGESNRAKAGGTLQSLATDSDTQHQPGPAKHKGLATSPKVMRRGANAPDGPQSNATPGRRANAIYRRKDAPRPKSTSGESDYPDASRAVRGSRTRRRRTDADLATSNGPGELTITINEQAGR